MLYHIISRFSHWIWDHLLLFLNWLGLYWYVPYRFWTDEDWKQYFGELQYDILKDDGYYDYDEYYTDSYESIL